MTIQVKSVEVEEVGEGVMAALHVVVVDVVVTIVAAGVGGETDNSVGVWSQREASGGNGAAAEEEARPAAATGTSSSLLLL